MSQPVSLFDPDSKGEEGHIRALVKAGVGIGVLDCFAGDRDPGLVRFAPQPVWTQTAWAEVHIAMAKAPRIRAVTDFLREVFAEEADLLAGNGSPQRRDASPEPHFALTTFGKGGRSLARKGDAQV